MAEVISFSNSPKWIRRFKQLSRRNKIKVFGKTTATWLKEMITMPKDLRDLWTEMFINFAEDILYAMTPEEEALIDAATEEERKKYEFGYYACPAIALVYDRQNSRNLTALM